MPNRPTQAESVMFRQDEVFWRGLFDIHLDPLAFIDENHRIVRGNLALAKALNFRQEDLVGRFCFELFHDGTCPIESCPHTRLLADGCEHACETVLDRLGGSFWISVTPVFDNTGLLVGCLHIARNVTAYKTLEADLRAARNEVEARAEARTLELKEHLQFEQVLVSLALNLGRSLADSDLKTLIQQGVNDIGKTGHFGRCVFWKLNGDRASALACYEDSHHALPETGKEETRATAGWLFDAQEDADFWGKMDPDVERCVVSIRPLWTGDTAYALVAERRVSASETRMALSSERLRLLCHLMGDALRRQASALESLRLREELTHLDRMARLGQLSASLAHELNQPLAATLCNAQAATRLLRQPQPDVLEACSALDDIVASARRAGDVMKQTRALFKGEEPAPQPIDLNALITAVLKLLRDEITFIGAVMIRLDSIIPPVLGNVVQLQQVLINLIKNALDAVKSEGEGNRRITLSTRVAETGTVVLCVADSGSGIKEGEEDRIFQPFHTGKPDGMGMGLPICRQIVKHYGGTITATRLPEGGACFTVSLPASTEA